MDWLREFSRWSHVIVGFTGLMAFWLPVFARKGATLHRRAGKVFVFCGYWVTASAGLSCLLVGWSIHRRGLVAQNPDAIASLVFLAYLAWVTFVTLRYGTGVLKAKKDPTLLATPAFRALAISSLLASLALVIFATVFPTGQSILLYALSPIGIANGLPMLKFMRGGYDSPKAWFYEHMSATLGAGIAFHTAFAVFGAARLFELPSTGLMSILPWILPAAIGTPGLILWRRHYQRKFGELPAKKKRPLTGAPASP